MACVAALKLGLVLALYALFRMLFEGARILRCTAGAALVACTASLGPTPCSLRGVVPLRVWERFPTQELATDRAFLFRTALFALSGCLHKVAGALPLFACPADVAHVASQGPVVRFSRLVRPPPLRVGKMGFLQGLEAYTTLHL